MSEQQKPRKGDKVRVTFDTVYANEEPYFHVLDETDGQGSVVRVPTFATVEVLERADDPSKDPLETVRKAPNGALAIRMHLRRGDNSYVPGWRLTRGSCEMTDEQVAGWPVVGAVPGSPAADCFPPEYPEVSGGGVPYPAEGGQEPDVRAAISEALHELNPICGGPTDLLNRIIRARGALREVV